MWPFSTFSQANLPQSSWTPYPKHARALILIFFFLSSYLWGRFKGVPWRQCSLRYQMMIVAGSHSVWEMSRNGSQVTSEKNTPKALWCARRTKCFPLDGGLSVSSRYKKNICIHAWHSDRTDLLALIAYTRKKGQKISSLQRILPVFFRRLPDWQYSPNSININFHLPTVCGSFA